MLEAELLEAIVEQPEDNARRLVYADLLLARGDLRGELIVVQLARDARPEDVAIEERERELIAEVTSELVGKTGIAVSWSRGFVDTITLGRRDTQELDVCWDPAFRLVRCLRAARPWLDSVPALAPALGRSVSRLELGGPNDSGLFVNDLEGIPEMWPRLRELMVTRCKTEAFRQLNWQGLAWLGVRDCAMGVLYAIVDDVGRGLETLLVDLRPTSDSDLTFEALAPILAGQAHKALRRLELVDAPFTNQLIAALATSPLIGRLEALGLSAQRLRAREVATLLAHRDAFANVRFVVPATQPESAVELAGRLRTDLGRPADAASIYRARVREASGDLRAWIGLAYALGDLGRNVEAVATFDALASRAGLQMPAEAWFGRYQVLLRLERLDDAAASLRRAADADFHNASYWSILSELLVRLGRHADAKDAHGHATAATRSRAF